MTPLARLPGWEARFVAALAAAEHQPFAWGSFDCALAMADLVKAIIGVDVAAGFRDRYHSKVTAYAALRRIGAGDLESTLTSVFGDPVAPAFARRGDVVLVDTEAGPAAGVVDLDGVSLHVAKPGRGLTRLPMRLALSAWRVG